MTRAKPFDIPKREQSSALRALAASTCPTAGYWEPDEPRGSRPVLRERGGETPPRHSTGARGLSTRIGKADNRRKETAADAQAQL
jgi:hypothetical protein